MAAAFDPLQQKYFFSDQVSLPSTAYSVIFKTQRCLNARDLLESRSMTHHYIQPNGTPAWLLNIFSVTYIVIVGTRHSNLSSKLIYLIVALISVYGCG